MVWLTLSSDLGQRVSQVEMQSASRVCICDKVSAENTDASVTVPFTEVSQNKREQKVFVTLHLPMCVTVTQTWHHFTSCVASLFCERLVKKPDPITKPTDADIKCYV